MSAPSRASCDSRIFAFTISRSGGRAQWSEKCTCGWSHICQVRSITRRKCTHAKQPPRVHHGSSNHLVSHILWSVSFGDPVFAKKYTHTFSCARMIRWPSNFPRIIGEYNITRSTISTDRNTLVHVAPGETGHKLSRLLVRSEAAKKRPIPIT